MKRFFTVLWATIFLLGSFGSSEAIIDRIVAVVNQEIIMLSEVEKGVEASGEEIQATDRLEKRARVKEIRQKVLNQLVDEKLIDIEIKRMGIKISSKEVEAALDEIRRRNNVNQEELVKALENQGLTLEVFKKQVEKKILRSKLVQYSIKIDSVPGEKELRDFYEKNADRYRANETYRAAHILVRTLKEASPDAVREARKKCQKVLDRIKVGDDFGEMALLYSEEPSAKDRGDLGYFKKGELLPAFEREALRLKVGEVSGIVRTDFGFHIIKLLDRKGGAPIPFEEIKPKVQADFYDYQVEKAYSQFLSSLREKSVIDIRL